MTGCPGHAALVLAVASLLPLPATAGFRYFDPTQAASIPKLLSETGLYSDIVAKIPDTALKRFEINAALWSDGAAKQRGIILPPGRNLLYDDSTDLFDYPDSTVFVKTFLLERSEGDAATRTFWETRFLVNKREATGRNAWHGFSYKWNAAATDAVLVESPTGLDTLFTYLPKGPGRSRSYKKWHFPSREECTMCHASRQVLGFFPAQLKRPSPANPSLDQVASLFAQGVFRGEPPTAAQVRSRWKAMDETIPAGLSAEERFRVVDTMARAYIAANCSGCHGGRGVADGTAPSHLNYDFHRLRPVMEFAHAPTNTSSIEALDPDNPNMFGRRYYLEAVARSGLDTSVGAAWHMAMPGDGRQPALVFPGFPAYSTLLFRQWTRRTPWRDSTETRRYLEESGDTDGWGAWLFSQPWGSDAWHEQLATHGVSLGALLSYNKDVGAQMPPLATSYIPDTAALKILGEWVKNYRSLHEFPGASIGKRPPLREHSGPWPAIHGRMLLLPAGWESDVTLVDMQGRSHRLRKAGLGKMELPAGLAPGVYLIRTATRHFRGAVLE